MKTTMHVVITNPADFVKNIFEYSVSLFAQPQNVSGWINVHPVEIDFSSVDIAALKRDALDELEYRIENAKAAFHATMEKYERERSELLALTFEPTGESTNETE